MAVLGDAKQPKPDGLAHGAARIGYAILELFHVTVCYSHLSADFQFKALERLVAKPAQTPAEQPTDTTTDNAAYLQVEAQPAHVQ